MTIQVQSSNGVPACGSEKPSNRLQSEQIDAVLFKRYLPPKRLSAEESRLVALLRNDVLDVAEVIQKTGCTMESLRAVERSRIIEIFLPEEVAQELMQVHGAKRAFK